MGRKKGQVERARKRASDISVRDSKRADSMEIQSCQYNCPEDILEFFINFIATYIAPVEREGVCIEGHSKKKMTGG